MRWLAGHSVSKNNGWEGRHGCGPMNDQRNIKVGQERGTDLLIAMAVGRSLFANTYTEGKASEQKIMSICGHENRILQSEETDLRMDVPPPLPLVPTQNIAK